MKTLIFIHGGESFTNENDYRDFLKNSYVNWQSELWTPEEKMAWVKEIAKKWHANGWVIYKPEFPNKQNARYNDWKIVFEWIVTKLSPNDEITLIWGSLGGCFLLKYFSEIKTSLFVIPTKEESAFKIQSRCFVPQDDKRKIRIHAIHLVAACISEWDFTPPTNYESLQQLWDRVHIWHAEDDRVVPFTTAQELSKTMPKALTHFFSNEKWYGHFHGIERIPELEKILEI